MVEGKGKGGGDGRQLRLLILVPVKLELIRKNICQDLENHFFLISLKLKLITLYFLDYGEPFIALFVSCNALEFKKYMIVRNKEKRSARQPWVTPRCN